MRRARALALTCTLLASTRLAALDLALPPDADRAAERITAASIRGPVRFLASDLLEGRGPASRGDSLAQAYIAARFEEMGLQPGAADGGWLQPFDLVGITAAMPATWSFAGRGGRGLDLGWWDDYIAGSGVQAEAGRIDQAEVVFVGYGMTAPEFGWDDFRGADVRGKVLLVLNNDPDWDPELFAGTTRLYYGRWDYKYENAARHGAAGAIIIHTRPSAGYPWQVVQTSWSGEQFELPAAGEARLPLKAWVTEAAARRLAGLGGQDLDRLVAQARKKGFRPVPLGVRTSIAFTNRLVRTRTANVLGLLPGSDPQLAREVVVYTAHHDHLGVGKPDSTGDRIYNGAVDNASGVATLLAIAGACAAMPQAPRRSLLFAAVATEESGLLGSEFYARHPTFQPGRIAANLNFDGVNIWGRTRDLTQIGWGKSSLDEVAAAVLARQGRTLKPDQFPDRGSFYRSDQLNFARLGVPALYLKRGTDFVGRPPGWGKEQLELWEDRHYHQPSDEMDATWNLEGAVEDARVAFLCGLAVANATALPAWKPGDEFEAARKAALEAVGEGGAASGGGGGAGEE
jgi:Zn-dependent M28 family amino/carboxypeptidase